MINPHTIIITKEPNPFHSFEFPYAGNQLIFVIFRQIRNKTKKISSFRERKHERKKDGRKENRTEDRIKSLFFRQHFTIL